MFYTTQGDIERAIMTFEKRFDLHFDGKKIGDCINECRNVCPKLHSDEELEEYAKTLIDSICEEFGFTGLRVYYDISMHLFSNDGLRLKYHKLIDDISSFVNDFRKDYGLTLLLDVLLANVYIKRYYLKEYGVIDSDDCLELYSLLNTLHMKGFDKNLVECLSDDLEWALVRCGDKYYANQDLSDVSVLSDLYVYVAEVVGDSGVFEGHGLFMDYDGYGGVCFNL